MDENCKLWVHYISAKIKQFEGFFKYCVYLIGRLPVIKVSVRSNNIWRVRAQNLQKETISWMLNQYEKYFKYKLHNRKCYTDETCHRYIS